jgi:hypothetical protein
LVELEKQQNDYEHWRRSNNHNSRWRLLQSLSYRRRIHWMLHSLINAPNSRKREATTRCHSKESDERNVWMILD